MVEFYEYNGDGLRFKQDTQAQRRAKLLKIYQDAVQKTQQADRSIETMRRNTADLFNSNLFEQRQQDDRLIEQLEENEQTLSQFEQETQDAFQRYQQAINSLEPNEFFECQPPVEDDRARLERLYSEF